MHCLPSMMHCCLLNSTLNTNGNQSCIFRNWEQDQQLYNKHNEWKGKPNIAINFKKKNCIYIIYISLFHDIMSYHGSLQ